MELVTVASYEETRRVYSGVLVLLKVTVSTTVFCHGKVWVDVTVEHATTVELASRVKFAGAAEEGRAAAKATLAQSATVVRREAMVEGFECAAERVDGWEDVERANYTLPNNSARPVRLHLLQ